MHYTAFVPYSVTAGCSLTGNTDRLLHLLCSLWLPSDPGIFQALQSYSWGFAMIQNFQNSLENSHGAVRVPNP